MPNIELFCFFAVHTKPCKHILINKSDLTDESRAILAKYSNWAYFDQMCKRKDKLEYLIYIDNKYAGFVELTPKRYFKQFYIEYVYLHPEYRGNGYSKMLFDFAVKDIRKNMPKMRTISAIPATIEGKQFMESVGFLPDIYHCSDGSVGFNSIYYIHETDIFVLDQPEYELLCGNKYNFNVCGVKRYMHLVNQAKQLDANFSAKNYAYYLAHHKKPRKRKPKPDESKYAGMFTITNDSPSLDYQPITLDAPTLDIQAPTINFDVPTFDAPSLDFDAPSFDAPATDFTSAPTFDVPSFLTDEQPDPHVYTQEVPCMFSDEYLQMYMKFYK